MERQGGGLIGTIQNCVDGVDTTVRLVLPTSSRLGRRRVNDQPIVQTGVEGARAVLDVGAAALTLNRVRSSTRRPLAL